MCQIPRQLRTIQYVDFSSSGTVDEAALTQLLDVLREEQLTGLTPESNPGEGAVSEHDQTPNREEENRESSAPTIITPSPLITNSIGMELILISPGEFLMGSEDGGSWEKPVRRVHISQPFYLGKYPVTQAQWQAVMGNNPSHFTGDLNRPVEQVSWEDAQEFLRKLNEREKSGKPYRLPTEAEWEYAARAGTTTTYCFGDDPQRLGEYAWYSENSGSKTHPVGQLKSNAWGLYDIHGNVWEWVQDWFAEDFYRQRSNPDRDPQGPDNGQYRVLRGGSWNLVAWGVRVADRYWYEPGSRHANVGFRCAQ
jgi:formylglycine-generating enzyme required for sulfatase activity